MRIKKTTKDLNRHSMKSVSYGDRACRGESANSLIRMLIAILANHRRNFALWLNQRSKARNPSEIPTLADLTILVNSANDALSAKSMLDLMANDGSGSVWISTGQERRHV